MRNVFEMEMDSPWFCSLGEESLSRRQRWFEIIPTKRDVGGGRRASRLYYNILLRKDNVFDGRINYFIYLAHNAHTPRAAQQHFSFSEMENFRNDSLTADVQNFELKR